LVKPLIGNTSKFEHSLELEDVSLLDNID